MALFTFLIGLALAQSEPPTEAEVAWAALEQQQLPSWQGRAEAAERRVTAREAFFAGEGPFALAFPDLVDARLGNRTVLRGRLSRLQSSETRRETERLQPLPPLSPEHLEQATAERNAALDAEERSDALLRRLLTRLDALLASRPELTDPVVEALTAEARATLAAPVPEDPDEALRHAREAARADATLARYATVQQALLLHGLEAGPAPDPTDDLLDPTNPHALARLWMQRHAGSAEERQAIQDALVGFNTTAVMEDAQQKRHIAASLVHDDAATGLPEETLRRDAASDQATLARLEATLKVLPDDHPLRPLFRIRAEATRDHEAATRSELERVVSGRAERSEAAAAAAVAARREAELAAAQAEDEMQRQRAFILTHKADATERLEELTALVEKRTADIEAGRDGRKATLDAYQTELDAIEDASPLPGTGPDADKTYARLRTAIADLAGGEVANGERIELAKEQIAEVRVRTSEEMELLRGIERTFAVAELLDAWQESLDTERAIADELLVLARAERSEVFAGIRDLTTVRREMRDYISWAQADIDNGQTLDDIGRELTLLEPIVVSSLSARTGQIVSSPWRLIRDGRLMIDLLWSMFWTVLLLGGWFWSRNKATDLAGRLSWQLRRARPDLKPIDLHRMKGPLAVAIRAGIDLVLGYLMVGRLSWISVEIAFLVECWLLLAIFRFGIGVFELAVVRSPEFRPSLAALPPKTYDLARFTTRIVLIWSIARGFTSYIVWGMLGMDATSNLLMWLFNAAGYGLGVWLLYHWDPVLRSRIRSRNQESRIVAFLSRDVYWLLRPLSALAMLVFFAATLTVDLGYWLLARDTTGLGRLFNVITRFQMQTEETSEQHLLTEEQHQQLTGRLGEKPVHVVREGLDDAFAGAFAAWKREGRRGMVAVVGDRGEGKRTEVERFLLRNDTTDFEVVRHRLMELMVEEDRLLHWLCELTGIEATSDPELLISRLRDRPRAVFVIEQAHRTFSRTVGGFDAIQSLLYVLNATSDHHFWLVTMHRPAWRFLSSIPAIVDVGVFRSVLALEPFESGALRELVERRAKRAGLTLDYSTLMRGNLLGADPRVELERATTTFFRLLADASEGNPRVALYQFAECLQLSDEKTAQVHRRNALATDVVQDVSVNALFALVALRQQDTMRLGEIVSVTNLPESTMRNIVRDLQSRGLVAAEGHLLYIPIHLLPLVTRTLRRRHLLYLGA